MSSNENDETTTSFTAPFPYQEHLPDAVNRLAERLARRTTVCHVCHYPLPSEDRVIRILDLIAEALFPGYFGRNQVGSADLPHHVSEAVTGAFELLSEEIARCIMHGAEGGDEPDHEQCEREGRRVAFHLMQKLPDLLDLLDDDVRAAFEGDPAATGYDEVIFCYPGFRAVVIQRVAHELYLLKVPWLPRIMTEYAHRVTGIDIHPGARIGRHFFIDHGTGVVIGETTEIGRNVRLYQGVTLGGFRFKTDDAGHLLRGYKRHPTIEDDVIIYANASILGPVTVGRGSVIGANAIITDDVPPGTQVTIEPPKHRVKHRGEGQA